MEEPVDFEVLRANIGYDREVEQTLLRLFVNGADGVFTVLERELRSATLTPDIWRDKLHLLKGSALNVGATPLAQAAARAEMLQQASATELHAHFQHLYATYREARQAIEERILN